MFACAMYPTEPDFIETVREEVVQQVSYTYRVDFRIFVHPARRAHYTVDFGIFVQASTARRALCKSPVSVA